MRKYYYTHEWEEKSFGISSLASCACRDIRQFLLELARSLVGHN